MAPQAIQPQSFAAGLESFGTIDWDAEFEELVSADDASQTQSEEDVIEQPEDEVQEEPEQEVQEEHENEVQEALYEAPVTEEPTSPSPSIRTVTPDEDTPAAADDSPNWAVYPDDDEDISILGAASSTLNAAISEANSQRPTTDFLNWDHPGWTFTLSPSWCDWTSTPPEVCAWAYAPRIWEDADWILSCSRHGDDYAHNDIPRIASLLRRAYGELYEVPEDAGVQFPWLAGGLKGSYRMDSQRPRELHRRGSKGLKKEGDPEIELLVEDYVPMGEVSRMRTGRYFPQRSHLSEVWNAEEMEFAGDVEMEGAAEMVDVEKDKESSEEEEEEEYEEDWAAFGSSDDEPFDSSLNTSVESFSACVLEEELGGEATTPIVKLPSIIYAPELPEDSDEDDSSISEESFQLEDPFVTSTQPTEDLSDIDTANDTSTPAVEENSDLDLGDFFDLSWPLPIEEMSTTTEDPEEQDATITPTIALEANDSPRFSKLFDSSNLLPTIEELSFIDELPDVNRLPAVHELHNIDELPTSEEVPTTDELPSITEPPAADILPPVYELASADEFPTIEALPTIEEPTAVDPPHNEPHASITIRTSPGTPERTTRTPSASPSPKLTGPGRSRSIDLTTTTTLPPPPSPAFLSPMRALRNSESAKKVVPARTLWQGFVGDKRDGDQEKVDWKNVVAGAVAVVGGVVAFLG